MGEQLNEAGRQILRTCGLSLSSHVFSSTAVILCSAKAHHMALHRVGLGWAYISQIVWPTILCCYHCVKQRIYSSGLQQGTKTCLPAKMFGPQYYLTNSQYSLWQCVCILVVGNGRHRKGHRIHWSTDAIHRLVNSSSFSSCSRCSRTISLENLASANGLFCPAISQQALGEALLSLGWTVRPHKRTLMLCA